MKGGGWVATHEDITERRRAEAKISYMARHDSLTDLPNRFLFHEQLEQALARIGRGGALAVLCLDIDHFKGVNDTLGHPVGDLLLKAVAARVRDCIRGGDTVARLDGDEFAIVQAGGSQPNDATALAARLIETVAAPFELDGHQIIVGASVGIAISPDDGTDPVQLLKNADMALYRAKADGRGVYRFFEPEMDARMQTRRMLELDLRKAVTQGDFELHYQPIVDIGTREVRGFEALVRWRHPQRGMVPPLDFIPLAEETGLIVQLGSWVLGEACRQLQVWRAAHPQLSLAVSVNISGRQLQGSGLADALRQTLTSSGIEASSVVLEITESVLMQQTDAVLERLQQLKGLGVRLAIDDFGTGYSSLSYLQRFPIDILKIAKPFVEEVGQGADRSALARAIIGLGDTLRLDTIAEGIEIAQQRAALLELGCVLGQGHHFWPAMPAAAMEEILAADRSPRLRLVEDSA